MCPINPDGFDFDVVFLWEETRFISFLWGTFFAALHSQKKLAMPKVSCQ